MVNRKRVQISPTGNISTPVGEGSVSVNPVTQSVGAQLPTISSGSNSLHIGVGGGPSGFSVAPRVQIGQGQGSATGSQAGSVGGSLAGAAVGGPVGAAVGGGVGSLIGSVIGSKFNESKAAKETDARNSVINSYTKEGLIDKDGTLSLPDGSVFSFKDGSHGHSWTNPDRKLKDHPDRELFSYETDYTNDTDYVAGMAGITLSRLLAGGTNKAVDQTGNALGNAFLGKVGYGKPLTEDNFNATMTNARAVYGKKGIKSKEDMLALANKAYSEGRINDFDYGVMQQTASLVFDNNFGMAQQLMGGRDKGLSVAASTPPDQGPFPQHQNKPGRIYSPILSPEEALLSVQPYFDYLHQHYPKPKGANLSFVSSLAQAAGTISAVAGAYKSANDVSGGKLGSWIEGGLKGVSEALGMANTPDVPDLNFNENLDFSNVGDVGSIEPSADYTLDSNLFSG